MAKEAHRFKGFKEWQMNFHGKQIRKPIYPDYLPNSKISSLART